VVATEDQRLRIVTGSGLADRLPDGTASEIIDGTITPLFRDGRIRDGVLAGLDQIRRHLGHEVNGANQLAEPSMAPLPAATDSPSEPVWVSATVLVVLVALIGGVGYMVLTGKEWFWDRFDSGSSPSNRFDSGSSSSNSGSSSSSAFGGGSSSGGGASGSW
jgi:uncharacterized protein